MTMQTVPIGGVAAFCAMPPARPNAGTIYPASIAGLQIMITNGAPHSPQKWAELVMNRLLYIGDESHPDVIAKAIDFKGLIERHLVEEFERVQLAHRKFIEGKAPEVTLDHHADQVTQAIVDAAKSTTFALALQANEFRSQIYDLIHHHLGTILMIEDQWGRALGDRPFGA